MKSKAILSFVLSVLFMSVGTGLQAISDQELLVKVDSLVSYYGTDFSAEYTIVQETGAGPFYDCSGGFPPGLQ